MPANCFVWGNMKIKGVLVVEGNKDKQVLSNIIDTEIVTLNGLEVSPGNIDYLHELSKLYPIIVLTDSDKAGENIRKKVNSFIPGCVNLYIDSKYCNKHNKHGIAEADKLAIIDTLMPYLGELGHTGSVSLSDFSHIKLNKEIRRTICEAFHLGECNNKEMIKRLNYLNITIEEVKGIL